MKRRAWSILDLLLLVQTRRVPWSSHVEHPMPVATEPLARRLQVSAEELTRWLAGEGIVDIGILPRAIDVLLDPSPPPN